MASLDQIQEPGRYGCASCQYKFAGRFFAGGLISMADQAIHGTQEGKSDVAAGKAAWLRDELPELLTAEEAARLLRVRPAWIYSHARELGGRRLLGEQGPWRFSRRQLLAEMEDKTGKRTVASATRRKRHGAKSSPSTSLLPIKQRPV